MHRFQFLQCKVTVKHKGSQSKGQVQTTHVNVSSSPPRPAGYCLLQPGHCVLRAGKALGSGAGSVLQRLLSVFWMLLAAPGWLHSCFFLSFLDLKQLPHLSCATKSDCVLSGCVSSAVKAGRGLLWFLAKGWYQLVSLMSLLNVFFLTR